MIAESPDDVTPAVLAEIARAPDPRFREVMGAAVRHAAWRLSERPHAHRLLLLLTGEVG